MYKDSLTLANEREEKLIEHLGVDEFLLSISKALDVDTKNNIYSYIMRQWDISDVTED